MRLATAFILLLAARAAAFDVTTILPEEGTVGTEIVISGNGFGSGKPKVWLQSTGEAKPKKYTLKVVDWSDTEIHAVVKKAVAGSLGLFVQPKGAGAPFLPASFEVLAPDLVSVDPAEAMPGDEFVLTGPFLGTKKPKVTVSGFKCKVKQFAASEVHAILSKKVFNGTHDVSLANSIGSDTLAGALQVSGSTAKLGKDSISGQIDGVPFLYKGGKITSKVTYPQPAPFTLWVGMTTVDGVGHNLILSPWYEPGVTPLPATFDGDAPYSVGLAGPLAWTDVFSPADHPTWITSPGAEPWEIVIEQQVGNQVQGHFSGQLSHFPLNDRFIQGSFVLTIGPPPKVP